MVPADPVSVAVALADKIDILTGFWAIDEKPTGSKDPYALRRAALGVIRLVIDNNIRMPLLPAFAKARTDANGKDLLSFFADRLKVQLREQGARHDLVDAVFALPGQDDLVLIVRRIEALGKFLDTDDGKNLLAGTKRAANILRIEEKKDNAAYTGAPDTACCSSPRKRNSPAPSALPRPRRTGRRARGFRLGHDRDVEASPPRRCILRQGHGQRRRQGVAGQPARSCSTKSARPPAPVADFSKIEGG